MRHVVMFSGGVGSFEAAWRVVQRRGRSAVTLLFGDTLHEDPDLYRFLVEGAAFLTGRAGLGEISGLAAIAASTPPVWEREARRAHLGRLRELAAQHLPQLVWLADGRDIWDVFTQTEFLGNSMAAPCTSRLKQAQSDRWRAANCDPATTRCYLGIDWTEIHRFEGHRYSTMQEKRERSRQGLRRQMLARGGWRYYAPLCAPPYMTKPDMLAHLRTLGIEPPRLYAMGFAHNNCGGGCVKAGIGHFALLYRQMPEVYRHWERNETTLREQLGDVSMLTDRTGGAKRSLPLSALRARIENGEALDLFDVGGCGCFVDDENPAAPSTQPGGAA